LTAKYIGLSTFFVTKNIKGLFLFSKRSPLQIGTLTILESLLFIFKEILKLSL